jgi:hypothetical protein
MLVAYVVGCSGRHGGRPAAWVAMANLGSHLLYKSRRMHRCRGGAAGRRSLAGLFATSHGVWEGQWVGRCGELSVSNAFCPWRCY